MKSQIITKSEKETIDFAEGFLKEAWGMASAETPLVFWLEGELGSGKTQFVKGLARGLGIKERITSPTFVLVKKFKIPRSKKSGTVPALRGGKSLFFHLDCYRMYDAEDARQIGIDEIIKNPKAVLAIEWAERIADIIPKPYWKLSFEHIKRGKRKIKIKYMY